MQSGRDLFGKKVPVQIPVHHQTILYTFFFIFVPIVTPPFQGAKIGATRSFLTLGAEKEVHLLATMIQTLRRRIQTRWSQSPGLRRSTGTSQLYNIPSYKELGPWICDKHTLLLHGSCAFCPTVAVEQTSLLNRDLTWLGEGLLHSICKEKLGI